MAGSPYNAKCPFLMSIIHFLILQVVDARFSAAGVNGIQKGKFEQLLISLLQFG